MGCEHRPDKGGACAQRACIGGARSGAHVGHSQARSAPQTCTHLPQLRGHRAGIQNTLTGFGAWPWQAMGL